MTDNEKLEEILDHRDFYIEKGLEFSARKEPLDWLIEKAIEAKQLKVKNAELKEVNEKTALLVIKRLIDNEIQRVNKIYLSSKDGELSLKCCRESGELSRLLGKLEEFEEQYL